ncbi:MAG: sterol desaturase family protein [Chitinophagaceae bacterium]|nr:MAG: sterol desaturase family protein [Chitinophagaceae bacterium]
METYGKILLVAMPAFLLLVLFEKWYGWKKGVETVRTMDMISSLGSGVTNVTKDVLGLAFVILSYPFLVRHLALTHTPAGFLVYVVAFIALDFAGYCVHRLQHVVNFFWNGHLIHHSSEDFNLACALRQSISSIVRTFIIFLLPAALLGVPKEVIEVVAPLHLFAQFWYHTRHIGKMGFLEKIIVTPSHHRVHHAINPEYIDRNYGQIFIVWDKWFGTFCAERADIPPVYGITRPVQTWNPVRINFQHVALLARDAWYTRDWKDKFLLWFKPTGYRPADMIGKYPVFKIENVYQFEKYDPPASPALKAWCWFQLVMLLFFLSYLFGNIGPIVKIDPTDIYVYGGFIFLTVYAMTELMDRHPWAWIWELVRSGSGLFIILDKGDWFGVKNYSTLIVFFLTAYFISCIIAAVVFSIPRQQKPALQLPDSTVG